MKGANAMAKFSLKISAGKYIKTAKTIDGIRYFDWFDVSVTLDGVDHKIEDLCAKRTLKNGWKIDAECMESLGNFCNETGIGISDLNLAILELLPKYLKGRKVTELPY